MLGRAGFFLVRLKRRALEEARDSVLRDGKICHWGKPDDNLDRGVDGRSS